MHNEKSVRDNAFNEKGMHIQPQTDSDLNPITYGCFEHLFILLAELRN